MNLHKKCIALCLYALFILTLPACGQTSPAPGSGGSSGSEAQTAGAPPSPESVRIRIAALKGPTAMGLVNLMEESGEACNIMLAGSADEVTPLLIKGELDMACVPANLAAVLYNRTEGGIITLAVNTLGVLYIVENGAGIRSMGDLRGKTIVSAGKGSTPEFGLRYLLTENGLDPDSDVIIDWRSEHSECVAALASGAADIAMLPQPFVTVAQGKIEGLRTALDLTAEWEALDNGSAMITGVLVARRAFTENCPQAVERFLKAYEKSVAWVNENPAGAAELIAEQGILDNAAVAEAALPHCNIVCLTGQELFEKLSGYLQVLFTAAPDSVGGSLPQDDFFYGI